MKSKKTFSVMALLTLTMIFFGTLHLLMSDGRRDDLRHRSVRVHGNKVAAQAPPQEESATQQSAAQQSATQQSAAQQSATQQSAAQPPLDVLNVSVHESLTQSIPQNTAYWNRLLYFVIRRLAQKKPPLTQDWSHCRETNQDVLETNLHDFISYPDLLKEFLRGMRCRSSPVLVNQSHKCRVSGKAQIFLLFAIKSEPQNFEQRQAVRETWAQEKVYPGGLSVRTVFLLGNSAPDGVDHNPLISFEAKRYGDVLQWDFHESFFNLTLKMNMFLQWTLKHCPHVSFVFSGDDDVFVNTLALLDYLQSLQPAQMPRLYVGHVISKASPKRDRTNKYFIPLGFYDGVYPAYAGGGGFLISGVLLRPLYLMSHVIPFFPIDDVYTAMCAKGLGVLPEMHAGFHTFDIMPQDRDNLCVNRHLILIHQRSAVQIKHLWRGIHNPMLTC